MSYLTIDENGVEVARGRTDACKPCARRLCPGQELAGPEKYKSTAASIKAMNGIVRQHRAGAMARAYKAR